MPISYTVTVSVHFFFPSISLLHPPKKIIKEQVVLLSRFLFTEAVKSTKLYVVNLNSGCNAVINLLLPQPLINGKHSARTDIIDDLQWTFSVQQVRQWTISKERKSRNLPTAA